MRVVPLLFFIQKLTDGLLFDERSPLLVPHRECRGKRRFVAFRERKDESPKFLASLGLRSSCKIFADLFDLMELAELYGNILEHSQESAPAVHDHSTKRPAFFFQEGMSVRVVRHTFACHFVLPNILLAVMRVKHTDTIVMTPVGGVGDHDGFLSRNILVRHENGVELFSHPDMRTMVFLSQLF